MQHACSENAMKAAWKRAWACLWQVGNANGVEVPGPIWVLRVKTHASPLAVGGGCSPETQLGCYVAASGRPSYRRVGGGGPFAPFSLLFSPLCVLVTQACLTLYDPVDHSRQAPLSMGCSRQEYWSGSPRLLQGIFLTQGSNPALSSQGPFRVGTGRGPGLWSPPPPSLTRDSPPGHSIDRRGLPFWLL